MTTDADVFFKQYDEPTFKTVPIEELSEKLIERDEELELLNGPYSRLHTIKKGTKLKYPALEAMRAEHNADDMLFGRIPIIDDDGYVDTRSNYRVFMGYIDEDHNITDAPEYHKKQRIALDRRKKNKAFNLYMPASYLKETYDISLDENNDYINMQKYQNLIRNLNTVNMKDMFNYTNGAYLNCILSGDNSSGSSVLNEAFNDSVSNHPNSTAFDTDLPLESSIDLSAIPSQLNSTNDTFNDSVSNHLYSTAFDSDLPLETSIDLSAIQSQQNGTSESNVNNVTAKSSHHESADEGFISLKNSPWSGMSEMDPYERSMLNPIVALFDCLDALHINPEEINEFTYTVGPEMASETRQELATTLQSRTKICTFTKMRPLETAVNCLKLPRAFFMGKSIFKLPEEYGCVMVVRFLKARSIIFSD